MLVSNTSSGLGRIDLLDIENALNDIVDILVTEIKVQENYNIYSIYSLQQDLDDALFNGNLDDILFNKTLQDMPLYINDEDDIHRAVAKWRLHVGK